MSHGRLVVAGGVAASLFALVACAPAKPAFETVRAEAEKIPGGRVFADASASGKAGLWMVRNGTATATTTVPVLSTWVEVRARGDQCGGAPAMTVKVDGRTVATTAVAATSWTSYGWTGTWGAGKHTVSIGFTNDRSTASCDRNLRVDYVAFRSAVAAPSTTPAKPMPTGTPTPSPTPTVPPAPIPAYATNPFNGATFYADPNASAAVRAAALRAAGDATNAALLTKIAEQPAAAWFTDAIAPDAVTAAVRSRVDTVVAARDLPVLVSYAIPARDCNGQSAGGFATAADYATWIQNFAAGIGTRKAVVVLEPDSIALWDGLSTAAQADRITNLRTAISALTASGTVAVYVDGGHSNWQSVSAMVDRLSKLDLTKVRGFATNVSNYNPTDAEVAYADQLAAALNTHYLVDTSRNGAGPPTEWCNPPGQALGLRPSSATTSPVADAWFWIKPPGESDGACNGGPPAGQWFESYALGLAGRAAW